MKLELRYSSLSVYLNIMRSSFKGILKTVKFTWGLPVIATSEDIVDTFCTYRPCLEMVIWYNLIIHNMEYCCHHPFSASLSIFMHVHFVFSFFVPWFTLHKLFFIFNTYKFNTNVDLFIFYFTMCSSDHHLHLQIIFTNKPCCKTPYIWFLILFFITNPIFKIQCLCVSLCH